MADSRSGPKVVFPTTIDHFVLNGVVKSDIAKVDILGEVSRNGRVGQTDLKAQAKVILSELEGACFHAANDL